MTASWLSGFLASSHCPAAHCTGSVEEGRWGGWEVGREEVGGGSVFELEAYAVKRCTTPCGAGCVEREIIFPAEKHSPMWTWHPHLLVCTFGPSFAHLDLSLLSFTCTISLSFLFYPFFIQLLPCNVAVPHLNSQRQAHKNWTLLQLLSLKLSLLAIILYAGVYVVLWRGSA